MSNVVWDETNGWHNDDTEVIVSLDSKGRITFTRKDENA